MCEAPQQDQMLMSRAAKQTTRRILVTVYRSMFILVGLLIVTMRELLYLRRFHIAWPITSTALRTFLSSMTPNSKSCSLVAPSGTRLVLNICLVLKPHSVSGGGCNLMKLYTLVILEEGSEAITGGAVTGNGPTPLSRGMCGGVGEWQPMFFKRLNIFTGRN